jgi:hypothetical protein
MRKIGDRFHDFTTSIPVVVIRVSNLLGRVSLFTVASTLHETRRFHKICSEGFGATHEVSIVYFALRCIFWPESKQMQPQSRFWQKDQNLDP